MSARARILVVDDDAVVRTSCERLLAADGHRVHVVSSGDEAMRELAARHHDLVVLDLRIPRMGGMAILQHIRAAQPDTQVVVITGHPTIENAKECIELGAFDYVLKPLDPTRIRTVVSRALACRPWTLQKEV